MTVRETVYRKGTGKEEGETRAQRGLALYRERGSEIADIGDDFYLVPSAGDEPHTYLVDAELETCGCPSFGHKGGTCKHLAALTMFVAKRRGKESRRRSAVVPVAA